MQEALRVFVSQMVGDVRIEYLTPDTTGIPEIRAKLDELDFLQKFRPDLLIVDYADKVRPPVRTGSDWQDLIKLYTALRAKAREWNVALWTASQTNREGWRADTPEADNVAGAFGKWGEVDIGLVLCQTRVERAKDEARLSLEALRGRPSGDYLKLRLDRARCTVMVLAQHNPQQQQPQQGRNQPPGGVLVGTVV